MVCFTIDELVLLSQMIFTTSKRSSAIFQPVPEVFIDYTYYRIWYKWWGKPLPPDALIVKELNDAQIAPEKTDPSPEKATVNEERNKIEELLKSACAVTKITN
jgi:predicted transcriptional regulator